MAPHLTALEQNRLLTFKGTMPPVEIHKHLEKARAKKGIAAPGLTTIRKFLKGRTHRRGMVETRGRKASYTRSQVLTMDRKRLELVKKMKDKKKRYTQLRWKDVQRAARVPQAHRTTAAHAFHREGLNVTLRRSREKPQRSAEHEAERKAICGKVRRYPRRYFSEVVDLIIDNKKFEIPTSAAARQHLAKQQARWQLRTPQEGLSPGFTAPNGKRHRINPGGWVSILAGISGDRVVLWEEVGKQWNGARASEMYHGPIKKFLKKKRGNKSSYLLVEDNDPSGYKSSKGMEAKKEIGIRTMKWPRYSPDLMPLDFSLWADVNRRMAESAPSGYESIMCFKQRLRRTALATSRATVMQMVDAIRKKAQEIYDADGGDIRSD